MISKPVLVVGAGPVGLTMAMELARYQVPVRIIERATEPNDKSRALAVWSRTLELLDRAGCAEAFSAAGLHTHCMNLVSGNEVLAKVRLDSVDSPFPCVLMLPQCDTERLLEEHLASLGVTVERGVELADFEQYTEGVQCRVQYADSQVEMLEASWLIGCDGAHSIVRKHLGMDFSGDTFPANFVLADVHVAGLPFADAEMAVFWHQDGVLVFFPIAPGRYRVMADIGSEPRHNPTLEEVQALVDQRGPGGVQLSNPVWLAGFGVNERKVSDYRDGRVFLAGDSAHIHSPAGGQGMNTGMQDAVNLAWKLALVEQGAAEDQLLESYTPERGAIAEQVLADSGRMIRLAVVRNRLAQHLRNFVAHHLMGHTSMQHAMADKLSEVNVCYANSPLNAGSAKGLKGPAAGERIVDKLPFGAGTTPRFALMADNTDQAQALLQQYPDLLEQTLRTPIDAKGMWLVRPDGYVAAVAKEGQWQVLEKCLNQFAAHSTTVAC